MKLYYSPGACSLSPHIALHESGLQHTSERVDLTTHTLADGTDYYGINPKGYVPALLLDTGELLTEGPAIVQYIADRAPAGQLAPANGTLGRYQLQEWLNFITAEVHKAFGVLFNGQMPDAAKALTTQKLLDRLAWVDAQLEGKPYLMGDTFSVADGYLYTVTNWAAPKGVDLSSLANLTAFRERVAARPKVQATLRAEGAAA